MCASRYAYTCAYICATASSNHLYPTDRRRACTRACAIVKVCALHTRWRGVVIREVRRASARLTSDDDVSSCCGGIHIRESVRVGSYK
eukprot:scaffold77_cov116-Isochrysis_galbana.AAC.19